MLIIEECVDDGIEDQFAASASYEPVVGEGDPKQGLGLGLGRGVYHVGRIC